MELETLSAQQDFWADPKRAAQSLEELAALKERIADWERFREDLDSEQQELAALERLIRDSGNEESPDAQDLLAERAKHIEEIARAFRSLEMRAFFIGPYDASAATLDVFSGAGGRDAADWALILLRMYTRYAERRGWEVRMLHEHRDPEGGVKSATIEIRGRDAYGWLRREAGVHRLVRISPFDAARRRHTSFAKIEILPVLPEATLQEIVIKPEEIVMEATRSSGPGGQNVNRRETAVRVSHLPTGLSVECQSERTQGLNRERALAILKAKILALREEERHAALLRERGKRVAAAWGNQIRSYVLHPYKLVRDHRTGAEHHEPEKVLDGDLASFIEAEIGLPSNV